MGRRGAPGGKRDLGQVFLTQERFLDAEVGYAGVSPADTVLEIGPGPGSLTARLAARAGHVTAVEYDRCFRPALEELARRHGNITLVWGDALTVPLPGCTKVVANLPYRVALPVIFRLLEAAGALECCVVIVQKGMARRICAAPGGAGYGRVSVTVQRLAAAETLDTVPADAFRPVPAVDSAIVRLRPVNSPFAVGEGESFKNMLDGLFRFREQPLGTALSRLAGPDLAAGLPGRLRGRAVSALAPAEFGEVSRFLESRKVRLPAARGLV